MSNIWLWTRSWLRGPYRWGLLAVDLAGHGEQDLWASHRALLGFCICLSLLRLVSLDWRDSSLKHSNATYTGLFLFRPQLRSVLVVLFRLYVLHLGCSLIEKHELGIGKPKARDQEADYWLQIAAQSWIVHSHMHTNTWCQLPVRWLEAWAQSWGSPHLWKCVGGCFFPQMNSVLIISQSFLLTTLQNITVGSLIRGGLAYFLIRNVTF